MADSTLPPLKFGHYRIVAAANIDFSVIFKSFRNQKPGKTTAFGSMLLDQVVSDFETALFKFAQVIIECRHQHLELLLETTFVIVLINLAKALGIAWP